MAEIGLWTDVEKFTQQKGVFYLTFDYIYNEKLLE
jgi:hypothetical protein